MNPSKKTERYENLTKETKKQVIKMGEMKKGPKGERNVRRAFSPGGASTESTRRAYREWSMQLNRAEI